MVALPDGSTVPSLGQGTWHMGESAKHRAQEVAALRLGIELGMTLIDTAEMYGGGGAEEVVGEAIAGQRDDVFLVSKVMPSHASRRGVADACARSLRRMKVETIDLYLLHWRGGTPVSETIEAFEALRRDGKVRHWGVSNFDADDMRELDGLACATDQVLYHCRSRGIEYDLLPWCEAHRMPIMAYSPIGQAGSLLRSQALTEVATRHGVSPAQVAIAWTLRRDGVISIPKASDEAHVRENAAAGSLVLSEDDLAVIDRAHPPPARKRPLDIL